MATTTWGNNNLNGISVNADAGDQFDPAVADSGGGSFGVAWASAAGVEVRFFDVLGDPDPALGSFTLNTSPGATVGQTSMSMGGAGVGYGVTWQETSAGGTTAVNLRYIGLSAPVGGVINVASGNPELVVHDVAMSGYTAVDATFRPLSTIDGLNVAWIQTDTSATTTLTPAQINAGYGEIMLQRYAVPLDAKKDPAGPPVAAGLDGAVGGASDAPVSIAAIGRDVVVSSDAHLSGDSVVAWVDAANVVHANFYTANGTPITTASGAIGGGVNLANLGTTTATGEVQIVSDGTEFVVAWATANGVSARVFAVGATPNTFTASPTLQLFSAANLPAGEAFNGEFSLGAAIDTGGFTVTVGATDGAGKKDLYAQSFTAGGGSDGIVTAVNGVTVGDQDQVATAALAGDRTVVVFRDTSAGDANIAAHIIDTRAPGQVIVGTPDTPKRAVPDVLVGTIGDDTIRGLGANDLLYGALGDDVIVGGAGGDTIDGGGNGAVVGDTAVFSGLQADYTITYLGADQYIVQDNRAGSPDGTDTVKGIELFRFGGEAGVDVLASSFIPVGPGVTPAAWGMTNADADSAPSQAGTPDVDGFLVNSAPGVRTGAQTNPFVADSVGEFVGVAWETPGADGNTHIRGQFYDVVLAPDAFIPNAINISDGVGIETNPVLTSGGANSGWGAAWEQRDNASDTTREIRTNFVGPGTLTGPELTVLAEGTNVDQHDAALSGSFLDRTLASPVGGSVLPVGMNEGYNVAWVSTDTDGGGDPDYGRIMLQRFEIPLDPLGNPGAPAPGGVDGIVGLGSDAAIQIAASGRNPSTAALHTFETAVIWIESNGAGGERVAGRVYDDLGQVITIPGINDISVGFPVAAGTEAHIVSAGAVNLGVAWVTGTAEAGYQIVGTMYASTGAGLNGEGFGFFAPPAPFVLQNLPFGIDISTLDFNLSGMSGEDSSDLIVTWKQTNGSDGADVMARHIAVTTDPATGQILSLTPEGTAITVNATTEGDQDQSSVTGLLGDRFISVYHDTNNSYTDGDDIVARVIDTRAPDQNITGDLIRFGLPQARRDVLVGTVGNDTIRGDIQEFDGRPDSIWGALGNDVIMGGPGLRGAAGVPEFIYGGEGQDISVYTGRYQDYSITVNGDGSYEIIDLRPTSDNNGNDLMHDGIDNVFDVEKIRFLNLSQVGGAVPENWASADPAFTDIMLTAPGNPPGPQAGYNGTPVNWSLTDTTPFKEISVDASAGVQSGMAVTNLQTGAALAWISGGGNQIMAISYDTTGVPDPVLLAAPTQLNDGGAAGLFADNTVSDIDLGMTAGLGFTAAWESTDVTGDDSADTSIHVRFASTNTHVVLAGGGGGVPGPGITGTEAVLVGSDGAGVAVDPTIQGYEIVNTANDTLEYGFHAGYVLKANAGDAYGDLMLSRYEIPVYDILVNGAGLPILDGAGQGQLATDAAGNFIPSVDMNTGSETAPISIGLDGLRGTADDSQAIVLTNAGLFSASDPLVGTDADHTPVKGRDFSIGTLHDGQLVTSYIDQSENVRLHIFVPHIDQNADRETGGLGGVDVQAIGHTTYSELSVPFTNTLGHVLNPGQTQYIVPQQNGSFGVFWADTDGAGAMAVKAVIYTGAGTNWIPSPVLTLQSNLDPATLFQVSPTGVTPGLLEDGYFLSWENSGDIQGQRYDMAGNLVGNSITIDDPANTAADTHTLHSAAGIDDGRILVGYQDAAGDVSASYLDTRQPGVPIIGPRNGALRDVLVGTVGDDSMDGRGLDDELYGGLGNDLITLGTGNDIGDGGLGNDTIIGGAGQDILIGGGGDDLLAGGSSGPADPKINTILTSGLAATLAEANANGGLSNTGLTVAQINAFTANNPGADMVSGGAGIDTITMQGEFGDFKINLATAVVESDRDLNGSFILEDVIGNVVDDGAGGQIFQFSADIENATGSFGDDLIIGNDNDNIIDVGGGSNTVDGAGGLADRMIIHAKQTDLLINFDSTTQTYTFIKPAAGTSPERIQTAKNVEFFTFVDDTGTELDTTATGGDLIPGPIATDDSATVEEDSSVIINVLDNDVDVVNANITAINGVAIVNGGPELAVSHGTVLLTNSGTGSDHVIFTPAANYFGPATFTYTVQDNFGRFATANVNVTVTNVEDAPTDIVFTGGTLVNENAANGTVISTLSTTDPDNTAVATNDTFTYTLDDNFGGAFQIVGNQIRVQNGALLDFESGVISYALNVTTDDGHGGIFIKPLTINVKDVNEAPTDIIFNGNAATTAVSIAELPVSNTVATLTATDPDAAPNGAAGVTFGLADSADGRFSITGNQISLVNPALIDFENPNLPLHSFILQTTAKDAGGLARTEAFTVNVTNSVENVVAGATTGNNTLNGTAGNDIINGLAGKDTMSGLAGNDTYFVDDSGDKITENTNAGNDTVYLQTLTSYGMDNNVENLIYLGTANATLRGTAINNAIVGGTGNDTIQGNDGNDHLIGNAGVDSLQGGNGNDRLYGSAGNDSLDGGNGNDWLEGGAGNDALAGGGGNDTFFFAGIFGADSIQKFGDVAGDQDLVAFSSNTVASYTALQSSMSQAGADVQINLVGVGSITLTGVTLGNLGADDFLFM